jgi:DNA-binding Lrp family transcriptional regulator
MMVNDTDIKIIKELQIDGRASNKVLAKRLGIHPSTVSRKIKSLINEGTITVRGLPNLEKLGYEVQALLAIDADMSKLDGICDLLYKNYHVNMLLTIFGRFNILVTVHYFNWKELLNFVSSELSTMDGVNKVETHFIQQIKKRYYGIFNESTEVSEIDDIDQKIIEKLAENGRYTARYLASDIGISFPTCVRRMKNLLKNNLVTVRALVNPTRVGYVANAFILLQVAPNHLEEACSLLAAQDDVLSVYTLFSGNYNIAFAIHKKTPEELFAAARSAINDISGITRIIGTEIFIRSEIKKRYYGGFFS